MPTKSNRAPTHTAAKRSSNTMRLSIMALFLVSVFGTVVFAAPLNEAIQARSDEVSREVVDILDRTPQAGTGDW